MPPRPHRAPQNSHLLLLQNLLSCQPGTSPFTLVLDTVEQPARALLKHCFQNAKASKTAVIFVSFESPPSPNPSIRAFVKARRKSTGALHAEIAKAIKEQAGKKTLVLIDTLHPLAALPGPFTLATYLSSLLSLSPQISLLAVYHLDIPLPSPPTTHNPYQPLPLTTLRYLCTTILTLHSLSHTLARRRARDRSLAEPVFGVQEEKEGVLLSVKDLVCADDGGMVLEIEHRRKSGRVVGGGGMIYLPSPDSTEKPMMLDEHPLFRALRREEGVGVKGGAGEGAIEGTFELGLTEKQRGEREGVVLPYFDAQKGQGPGQGGRILYEMGVEDDFDEEEDEI